MKKPGVYLILCIICIGAFHFNSCTKKTENTSLSNTELITGKWWNVTAQSVSPAFDFNGDGTPDADLYAVTPPCDKDDIFKFNTDGTITLDKKTLCNGDFADTNGGTWTWNSNETKFIMTPPSYSADPISVFTVNELTAKSIKVTMTQILGEGSGTSYTFTLTMTAK